MHSASSPQLWSCHCCGLIQTLPSVPPGYQAICQRCRTVLRQPDTTLAAWTKVLAISALMFYPPALLLPMLRIEQFGHTQEAGLLAGVGTLWEQGHWFIGTVVLLFSIALPPLKLIALWLLSTPAIISRQHHRALLYHLVELLGRWGMLDVMLVAVLVAFVKLGDMIAIQPGSGLLAFAIMVLLSLLASVTFNPTLLWDAGGDGSKNAL